jgi:glucose/arabinose dehydrogenase
VSEGSRNHRFRRLVRRLATVVSLVAVIVALPGSFERREPPVPTPSPTPRPSFAGTRIKLTRVSPLKGAIAMAVRDGDPSLYVATKAGRVVALRDGRARVVLDIRDQVLDHNEQGFLGLAFHPNGKILVIDYVDRKARARVRALPFEGGKVTSRGKDLFVIPHPTEYHYAGHLAFGPDGYLYVSQGDGGHGTPSANAQRLDVLLGKMLRVDVRPDLTYRVPEDNPFVGREGARPEIWAYGLRNPWRFSFDAVRGDMWIADPGRTAREEVNLERADSKGGRNYGWNRMEGTSLLEAPPPASHVLPIHEYDRAHGCAIIGGYVYRGKRIPGLNGAYFYADHCTGRLEALRLKGGRAEDRMLGAKVVQPASFGEDRAGELHVLSLAQGVFRIDPA